MRSVEGFVQIQKRWDGIDKTHLAKFGKGVVLFLLQPLELFLQRNLLPLRLRQFL